MEENVNLFQKPEELVDWLDDNDLLMNLSVDDARLLLEYMEGHDYALGMDQDKFIRQDMGEVEQVIEEYSIDDAIDAACKWNYEFCMEKEQELKNCKDFIDFANLKNELDHLRREEHQLDQMFDKTTYGKQIEDLAQKLAENIVANYKKNQEVGAVSERMQEYLQEEGLGGR